MDSVARALLRSPFKSRNLAMVRDVVGLVRTRLPNGDDVCRPHLIALEYLESGRDPAIVERQHPEMRDAVELLVGAFDQGDSLSEHSAADARPEVQEASKRTQNGPGRNKSVTSGR